MRKLPGLSVETCPCNDWFIFWVLDHGSGIDTDYISNPAIFSNLDYTRDMIYITSLIERHIWITQMKMSTQ